MDSQIQKIRKAKFIEQRGRCFYCRQPMWESDVERFAQSHRLSVSASLRLRSTAEHLIAQQDGGADAVQNIVAACQFCNLTRHKSRKPKTPADFALKVRSRLEGGKWHRLVIEPIEGH